MEMMDVGRRGFLARLGATALGLSAAGSGVVSGRGPTGRRTAFGDAGSRTADGSGADGGFDPTRDGFGFPNWAGGDTSAYPGHDHRAVSNGAVERRISNDWRGDFSDLFGVTVGDLPPSLVELVSSQIRVAAAQLASTNGHCYGMMFAAQELFESPELLGSEVDAPADIHTPEVTLSDGETTLGSRIDHFQSSQLLDVYAWVGRRRMLDPARIDYAAELSALTACVDAFGTAGITLVNAETRRSHQVLVYGYEEASGGVELLVYDPNVPALGYSKGRRRTLSVRPGEASPVVGHPTYDALVFNRWDRAIRAGASVTSPRRADDREDFGHLLDCAVRFSVDSADVSFTAVGPDGDPVGRTRGEFLDRTKSEVHATRYLYGAPHGTYRLSVVGRRTTPYELRAQVAGMDGGAFDRTVSGTVRAGEVHEYTVRAPEGSIRRAGASVVPASLRGSFDPSSALGGAIGGAALGGYLAHRRGG